MKKLMIILLVLMSIQIVSASDMQVWQGQYYTGTTFNTGTYEFNFTVYNESDGGVSCYSNTTNLTTGNWGQWKIEQSIGSVCNNSAIDYFLEINIDNVIQSDVNGNNRSRLTLWDYLRKDVADTKTGDLTINDILKGLSPLKLEEVLSFVDATTGEENYAFYVGKTGATYSDVPSSFNNTLIIQTVNITNDYKMEICFWDKENQKMIMCLNEGAPLRATTIRRSFQIVGNLTVKENDENFTLCEGANYVDCSTDITGADFFVQDDIETLGSIYANENIVAVNANFSGDIYANGTIDSEDGIGVTLINAINISTDNLNADLVQAPLGKFTNITGDKLNIDLIYVIDIIVDNLEVTDLITGSNSGTDLCVDSNNVLCVCGSCA